MFLFFANFFFFCFSFGFCRNTCFLLVSSCKVETVTWYFLGAFRQWKIRQSANFEWSLTSGLVYLFAVLFYLTRTFVIFKYPSCPGESESYQGICITITCLLFSTHSVSLYLVTVWLGIGTRALVISLTKLISLGVNPATYRGMCLCSDVISAKSLVNSKLLFNHIDGSSLKSPKKSLCTYFNHFFFNILLILGLSL